MTGRDIARMDLAERLARAGQRGLADGRNALAADIEAIRRIALANGLAPAAGVAHALEMALGRGERGPLIEGWIAILADALDCDRTDQAACDSYAAACSVRLVG